MNRLSAAAGVDFAQWRALMRAYTLTDFETLLGADGAGQALRAAARAAFGWGMLVLIGAIPAAMILAAHDTWLAATVMTTTTIWLVGTMALLQGSSIIVPQDFGVIGFRPVTSRTYLAVRLGAVLFQSGEVAGFSGCLPVVAFLVRPGGSWVQSLAAAAGIGVSALLVIFTLIAAHGSLLRVVRAATLQRAMHYLQIVAVLGVMGAWVSIWTRYSRAGKAGFAAVVNLSLPRSGWALVNPGTWPAAYVQIARGQAGRLEIVAAAISLAALAGLLALLRGRLSADYAARVAELETAATGVVTAPRHARPLFRDERRAMWLLMAGQLRGDLAVQSQVVTGLFVSAIIFGSMRSMEGLPTDPFVGGGQIDPFQFGIFYLGISTLDALSTSGSPEAAWALLAAPADRARLVMAGRDMVALTLLGPALALLAGFFVYAYGNVQHALTDVAVCGAAAYLAAQLSVLINPVLLFSRPHRPSRGVMLKRLATMPLMILAVGISLLFQFVLYPSPLRIALGGIVMAGSMAGLNSLTRWRVQRRGVVD